MVQAIAYHQAPGSRYSWVKGRWPAHSRFCMYEMKSLGPKQTQHPWEHTVYHICIHTPSYPVCSLLVRCMKVKRDTDKGSLAVFDLTLLLH